MEVSDWIAGIALFVSMIVGLFTIKNYRQQSRILFQQERLNELLLKKENQNELEEKCARFHVTIVKIGNSPKLRVSNIGKNEARNISISFDNLHENHFVYDDSLFPLDLKPNYKFEILLSLGWDSPSKFKVYISWDDDFKTSNNESFTVTR